MNKTIDLDLEKTPNLMEDSWNNKKRDPQNKIKAVAVNNNISPIKNSDTVLMKNRRDSLKNSSKDGDRNGESGSKKSKKVNIVVVGGQSKYAVPQINMKDPRIQSVAAYKEHTKTTPRLLQKEQQFKIESKTPAERSIDFKKKYSDDKRQHDHVPQKLIQGPTENSFEIYGIKKPVKAYDSPEFFKKADAFSKDSSAKNGAKTKQFKIAPYNSLNRTVNPQQVPTKENAPKVQHKQIKIGASPLTNMNSINMNSTWNNQTFSINKYRDVGHENGQKNTPNPQKKIYYKTDTNFVKKAQQMSKDKVM